MAVVRLPVLRNQAGTEWSKQRWTVHKILAHRVTDTDAGQWVSVEGVHRFMVTFEGDFKGGQAILLGSCYKPASRDGDGWPSGLRQRS